MSPIKDKFIAKYMRLCEYLANDKVHCLSRGVAAVIIDIDRNTIISSGWNGPPKGLPHCNDAEYVENYLIPIMNDRDKEIAKRKMAETGYSQYSSKFNDDFCDFVCKSGKCPRQLLDYKSGEALDKCTCLSYESRVILDSGKLAKIGDLVRNKYTGSVQCYDIENKTLTTGQVIGWYEIPSLTDYKQIITLYSRYGKHGSLGAKYTPDHKILTPNGWKMVGELVAGDKIYTSETELSYTIQQLVYGSLMGDASITRTSGAARFVVSHSSKYKEYSIYKSELLDNFLSNISENTRDKITPNGRLYKKHKMMRVTSIALKQFKKIRNLVYVDEIKRVTQEWLDKVDELGLAFWYMDDGSFIKTGKSCYIAANKFEKDFDLLLNWLSKKFNIIGRIISNKRIYFNPENTNKLHKIIAKYIPQVMKYKICNSYKDVKLENPAEKKQKLWIDEIMYIKNCDRIKSQNRTHVYCIDVDKYNNFLTLDGIAHNCAHAEQNAIDVAGQSLHNAAIFVSAGVPCIYCCRDIINSGVKYVYCLGDNYPNANISIWMLKRAGLKVINVNPEWIKDEKNTKLVKYEII